jgi:tRNA (cmo5U34)-methyltransferase
MMEDARIASTEEASETYRQLSAVAVPAREGQIATVLALLPFGREQCFRIVDLACGDGPLTYAVLDAFPNATALALDGSAAMCSCARSHLSGFG